MSGCPSRKGKRLSRSLAAFPPDHHGESHWHHTTGYADPCGDDRPVQGDRPAQAQPEEMEQSDQNKDHDADGGKRFHVHSPAILNRLNVHPAFRTYAAHITCKLTAGWLYSRVSQGYWLALGVFLASAMLVAWAWETFSSQTGAERATPEKAKTEQATSELGAGMRASCDLCGSRAPGLVEALSGTVAQCPCCQGLVRRL